MWPFVYSSHIFRINEDDYSKQHNTEDTSSSRRIGSPKGNQSYFFLDIFTLNTFIGLCVAEHHLTPPLLLRFHDNFFRNFRKFKFLSKYSIFTKLTIFLGKSKLSTTKMCKIAAFSRVFTQIFLDNFSREIKVVNSYKVQNYSIFTSFHPTQFDNFSREIKVEFLNKKWRFQNSVLEWRQPSIVVFYYRPKMGNALQSFLPTSSWTMIEPLPLSAGRKRTWFATGPNMPLFIPTTR